MIDPGLTLSEKRAIAGRKGGRRTAKRYGKRYMRKLARWGALRMHAMYALEPVALNDFAIVHKETGQVKALLSGKPIEAVFGDASVMLPVSAEREEFA
ncbi:MAG: hypothetical protein EHM40_03345 [Chloroflexi bacterium]|nr:MAG: hypothetical protein EHM40_03345 [Chloroflexota bacterium]